MLLHIIKMGVFAFSIAVFRAFVKWGGDVKKHAAEWKNSVTAVEFRRKLW